MRAIALLATYNEERFIAACVEHLIGQGLEVYLMDNQSIDRTVEIAKQYLNKGVIGIETISRTDVFQWTKILQRKEQLAATLGADWYMHVDADEIRLAPTPDQSLIEGFAEVERKGYNAINFMEFTFVPTREAPNHDHPDFQQTMNYYYPFLPSANHQVKAWKQPIGKVELASSGGHHVRFPGLRVYPQSFFMKHYLFLSVDQAIRKYVKRLYDPRELERGMHRARAKLESEQIWLQPASELRCFLGDMQLNANDPFQRHPLFCR